jgi:hypothetical protein
MEAVCGPRWVGLRCAAALVLAGVSCGCMKLASGFACRSSDQCLYQGVNGTCEPSGWCSFPDATCASGRRYGSAAGGGYASTCATPGGPQDAALDVGGGGDDSGHDGPMGDTPVSDAARDTSPKDTARDTSTPHDTPHDTGGSVDVHRSDAIELNDAGVAIVHLGDFPVDWTTICTPWNADAGVCPPPPFVSIFSADNDSGGQCVEFDIGYSFDFAMITPPGKDLGHTTTGYSKLSFSVRAENSNTDVIPPWQSGEPCNCCPWLMVGYAGGMTRYEPTANLLPVVKGAWQRLEVPLAGGSGWSKLGPSPSTIDWVEVHTNTWGYAAYTIWIDDLVLE